MPCKLRFYSNTPRNFQDFFSAFTNHIEQTFEDIFNLYKKYFREIDVLDFDNFFKPNINEKYLNKDLIEDKSSILPYKVHANFMKKQENNNKRQLGKNSFKYDFDESSFDNLTNNENNNKDYKIRINRVDSVNKSNVTTTNINPNSKKSDNFFDSLEKNISQETPNRSTFEEIQKKNAKNTSFYSFPQSNNQINSRNLNFDNFSVNLEGNKAKNDDFVMRNVQKVQKMYSSRGYNSNNRGVDEVISRNNEDFQRNKNNKSYFEENSNGNMDFPVILM